MSDSILEVGDPIALRESVVSCVMSYEHADLSKVNKFFVYAKVETNSAIEYVIASADRPNRAYSNTWYSRNKLVAKADIKAVAMSLLMKKLEEVANYEEVPS